MAQKKESKWVTIVYALAGIVCGALSVLSFCKGQFTGGIFSAILALAMFCMAFVHFVIIFNQSGGKKKDDNEK